ncbi:MAG: GGDEF domain-containing protein, partial [Paracoccus sp. (in: a-proteobacteria)]
GGVAMQTVTLISAPGKLDGAAVSALRNAWGGGEIRVTASVGLATVPSGGDGWPDQIAQLAMERADRALLSAKATGRNRVVSAPFEQAA